MSEKEVIDLAVPPVVYERNEYGLLKRHAYVFNEDGSVNWRAMIKPEFLYPNRDWFLNRNLDVPDSIEGCEHDRQLLIMLGGIKELAKLRGFHSVSFNVISHEPNIVVVKCSIDWIPNYENPNGAFYEEVANAAVNNTDDFCHKFLESIACNRAFVRCVRNFLNIHIVGADEIDRSKDVGSKDSAGEVSIESSSIPKTPVELLKKKLQALGVSDFEGFKEHLRKMWKMKIYQNEKASEWTKFEDIPTSEVRKLVSIV